MSRYCLLLGVMLICAIASSSALADEVTYSGSVPLTTTNWSSSISIPKFDPTLGNLTGLTFSLTGYVQGSAKFESLDAAPATVTMDVAAQIKLQRPDLTDLVVVLPTVSTSDSVTMFDGTIDFGGTSGKTYAMLSNSKTETFASPPPLSDLALFTGVGNIVLPVAATGMSKGTGAGNLLTQFNTSASADARVKYVYTPNTAVPEASSVLLALSGLGTIAGLTRLRRR